MSRSSYLLSSKKGRRYQLGGCIMSDKPSNAPKYGAVRTVASKDLPPVVDLRALMTPVEEQLETLACVPNALAGAYEFLIMKDTKKHIDVSRLFIYYNARRIDGMEDYNMQDTGTQIKNGIESLVVFGCCKESLFPYKIELINRAPSKECYESAKHYRIASSMSIEVKLDEMKACLAEGFPFIFGLELFQSFENAETNSGHVPMPENNEQEASAHRFHAMLAVGYIEPWKCFIVRNSWGPDWGDKGYCYIPYDYMTNAKHCRDLHAIKTVTRVPPRGSQPSVQEPQFDSGLLWKWNNMFDFANKFQQNGPEVASVWQKIVGQDSKKKIILWIDTNHEGNQFIADKLSADGSTQIEFCETMKQAQDYLLTNKNFLRSLTKFQIISRGFYKDEKKNPLDVLEFLITKRISNAQVFVFTQDRKGVEYHLEKQASTVHINNWKERLTICEDPNELMEKIQQSFHKQN